MIRSAVKLITATVVLLLIFTSVPTHASDSASYFDGIDNAAYVDWSQGSSYTSSIFLPSSNPENGAAIHWSLDDTQIYLAVAARATGWVGFGISEAGGMKGADMALFTAATNSITDAFVLDELNPLEDDCQSWTLVNSQTEGGFLIFEVVRLLDTGDTQDRPIVNDTSLDITPHRIIAAWGDSEVVSYHGPTNRVQRVIRFYGDSPGDEVASFERAMQAEAEGSILLTAIDYPIKPIETEYAGFCFSKNDLINLGMPDGADLHVVGMEPVLDSSGGMYAHHFVLYTLERDWGTSGASCDDFGSFEIGYAWAPGETPMRLPSDVGSPLGLNGYNSYKLEIHYNNPTLNSNSTDSSGVRLYFTSQKRKYDLGVVEIGDPLIALNGEQVGNGLVRHDFNCPSGCSSLVLQQDVVVILESLHMHRTGVRMYNSQLRNGEVLRVGAVDFYDFDQQGSFVVQQPAFDLQPGDSFQTACYYNGENVLFGRSSQEEMCIAFLFYYPRQTLYGVLPYACGYQFPLPVCATDWIPTQLNSTSELSRTFGAPMDKCAAINGPSPTMSPVGEPAGSPTDPAPSFTANATTTDAITGATTSGTTGLNKQSSLAWTMAFLIMTGIIVF